MDKIAVVLPAYNEAQTIEATIRSFFEELPHAFFVIVNNASTDDTEALARQTLLELAAEGEVINEPRPGKGNAVRTGLTAVDADIYVIADADLTYPAGQVHELISPVKYGLADMVVGDRVSHGAYRNENKRSFHNFGNALVCWLVNTIFRAKLKDIMSGYRVLNRLFARNYPVLVEGFQIETDMTLHALDKRFRVKEIPVEYKDRPEGSESKLNTFSDGANVLLTIGNIFRHYRPMLFFGTVAVIVALCSIAAGIPVIDDWIQHRYIYHVPLAVLASGLMLISCLLFVLGLILDSIAYQHRQNFERRLSQNMVKGRQPVSRSDS